MKLEIDGERIVLDSVQYKSSPEREAWDCYGCAFDGGEDCNLRVPLDSGEDAWEVVFRAGLSCTIGGTIWIKAHDIGGWKPDPVKSGQEIMDITRSLVG